MGKSLRTAMASEFNKSCQGKPKAARAARLLLSPLHLALVSRLYSFSIIVIFCWVLVSCDDYYESPQNEHPPVDVKLLSTDVYISVAHHTLNLPLIALGDYGYRLVSASYWGEKNRKRAENAVLDLLQNAKDKENPLEMDALSIVMQNPRFAECTHLKREWARSWCKSPWTAINEALPSDFKLVNLNLWKRDDIRGPRCDSMFARLNLLPHKSGSISLVCKAEVAGGDETGNEYYIAVLRIHDSFGAVWIAGRYGVNGEPAQTKAEREGKAIFTFVKHAIGLIEDYPTLVDTLCGLRQPRPENSPYAPNCPTSTRDVNL